MTSLPITPPKARVDVAPKSSSPPTSGSSGAGDFAALLNQTSARTAPAEGQKTRPASSDQQTRRRDDDSTRATRAQAKEDNTSAGAQAAADAARPHDADGTTDQTGTPADGQQSAGQDASGQGAPQGQPGDAQAQAAAAAAAAAATAAQGQLPPAGAPAAGTPAPGAATAPGQATDAQAQAALAAATDGAAPATAATAAGKLQIPAELLAGKDTNKLVHLKDLKNAGGDASGLPPAPTLPPSATAAATAPATGGGAGDAGANANNNGAAAPPQAAMPPTIAAAQPAATPQAAVPTAAGASQLTRGSVVQTAERVQELVRIATTRAGNARATLQLKPEALGQVDVQLRTTRDGLVATISAHDKAGLDALQNAASELRRTLEDRGVELHSLDLQLGAGDNGFSNQGDARQASTGRGGGSSSYGLEDDDDVVSEDDLIITTPTSTPAGALVDVTA